MEHFKNESESFFREIRKIEIYSSTDISYEDNFAGNFPSAAAALYTIDIIPEEFERKIPRKKRDGNYYHDIDLGFPLLDMSKANREKYQAYFNKKAFAVVLHSNVEKMMLGNNREPVTIEVLDLIKDNASGSDEYYLSITGDTIITPKINEL